MCSIQKGVSILAIFLSLQRIVNGECENVPQVPKSSNNATKYGSFADGSAIEFTCNPGYKGVGSTYYYCRGSEWAGNFSCLRVCPEIKTPQNGLIVRLMNTRLEFACLDGYILVGSSSMLCGADGNWRPEAPPTCDPVSCEAFGSVPNGEMFNIDQDGVLNDFGSKFQISCNDGYNLIGAPTITCKSDGTWSSRVECEASLCGTHPGTKSKCIDDSSTGNNRNVVLLSLLCLVNSVNISVTVVGSGIAYCENNQWDNLDLGCFCDCLVDIDSKEGISYNNLFKEKFVKHGDQLNWNCKKGYRKQGSTNISCYDGLMDKPHCVRKMELNERKEHGAVYVFVAVGIIVVIAFVGIIFIFKGLCFNEKKGSGVDEERPVTNRFGGTTKNLFAKRSKNCEENKSSSIELATGPLIHQSSHDQCDTETPTTQTPHSKNCEENKSSSIELATGPLIHRSSHDQCDTETPTTQTPHSKSNTETPTSQTSFLRLPRCDRRKRLMAHLRLMQSLW